MRDDAERCKHRDQREAGEQAARVGPRDELQQQRQQDRAGCRQDDPTNAARVGPSAGQGEEQPDGPERQNRDQ